MYMFKNTEIILVYFHIDPKGHDLLFNPLYKKPTLRMVHRYRKGVDDYDLLRYMSCKYEGDFATV